MVSPKGENIGVLFWLCLKMIAYMFIHVIIIYSFVRRILEEYFFVNVIKSVFTRFKFLTKKFDSMSLSPCCFSRLISRTHAQIHTIVMHQKIPFLISLCDRSFGKDQIFPWSLFALTLIISQKWYACTQNMYSVLN